jgi:hypothetical protein
MNTRLRSVLLSASLVIAGFSAVTFTSCQEDKCKAIVCANGSVCNEGYCLCPSGYEGPRCETVNRDRFLGIWNVKEDGSISAPAQYTVVISKGDAITQVKMKNFRNFYTEDLVGTVKGDTVNFQQTLNGSQVQGTGYLADDPFYGLNGRMTVRYKITTPTGQTDDYGLENPVNPSEWTK